MMEHPQSTDTSDFRDFEHSGWQKIPRQYHNSFADLTSQSVGPLLDAVGAGSDVRLLDVATGPGYAAAAATLREAKALGVDFSSAMVAEARRQYPGTEFKEGDAEKLPFDAGRFDAVINNYGMLHFGRPETAFREAHRVLRSGGRFAFAVWCRPEAAAAFAIVLRAIQEHGNMEVPLPPGPSFFRFSDPEECKKTLLEASFTDPNVVQVPQIWRLRSPDALFDIMRNGTVRTAGLLAAQTAEALDAIRTAVRKSAEAYRKGEGIELPMPAVVASAVKS